MKRIILLSAFVIVTISLIYSSLAIVERSSAFPQITLTFTKNYSNFDPSYKVLVDVSSIKLNITDERGRNYPYNFTSIPLGGLGNTFALTTLEPLMNGNYTLQVFAKDIVGNEINTTQTLDVEVPYMGIAIGSPPLSVSPKPVFDLVIKTEGDAYGCKYDSFPVIYSDASFTFQDLNPRDHAKLNFNNDSAKTFFGLQDGRESPIYLFCKDNESNRINPQILNISYDTTRPSISFLNDQIIITDTVGGKVLATADVLSNDKVVCRYGPLFNQTEDAEGIKFASTQSNFSEMTGFFGRSEDEANESQYSIKPETTIDLTDKVVNITTVYTFKINIACINRATLNLNDYGAQRVSATLPLTVIVNLIKPITIQKISPADFTAESLIFINLTTNRIATCSYKFNGTLAGILAASADERVHNASLGEFQDGSYDLDINCTGRAATSKNERFRITIDNTPPSQASVISPNATCTKELSADFDAVDNESDIAGYNYSIVGLDINDKFTSSNSVSQSNLNLSNQSSYSFTAVAINRAGLPGPSGQGNNIVYDPTGVLCDRRPPSIFIKQNTTATGVFVMLICIDSETECNNNSYSYLVSADSNCEGSFQPITYDAEKEIFGVLVTQEGYFCYEAEDLGGNKAKGSEKIKFQSSSNCYNSIEDGGETDVDCGGMSSCVRCDIGKKCGLDSDCVSLYCQGGLCQEPLCTDNLKNGYETDVDCGGSACGKCGANKSCISNSDCELNYCNALLLCDVPACNDLTKNGNETDVDCGGSACNKCALGKFCIENSDCVTSDCFGGECVQQPIPINQTQPIAPETGLLFKILKIIFLMLGVLGIFGGSGYLYYKKSKPKKPAPLSGAKSQTAVSEEKAIAKPRALTPEEKIRKLTVQEQMKREKEETSAKREKLFGLFGAPGKIPPKEAPNAPKLPAAPVRRITIPQIPKQQPAAAKKPEQKPEDIFGKLGRMKPREGKEAGIFEKLGLLKGQTEFEKLENIGKGKKAEEIEKLKKKRK